MLAVWFVFWRSEALDFDWNLCWCCCWFFLFFFFFQAEDGIRDRDVTGVQTCALPISGHRASRGGLSRRSADRPFLARQRSASANHPWRHRVDHRWPRPACRRNLPRSEERRVGKEWRSGWWRCEEKKEVGGEGEESAMK